LLGVVSERGGDGEKPGGQTRIAQRHVAQLLARPQVGDPGCPRSRRDAFDTAHGESWGILQITRQNRSTIS